MVTRLSGGDEGDRTLYLLNAIQALSQVSYVPGTCIKLAHETKRCQAKTKTVTIRKACFDVSLVKADVYLFDASHAVEMGSTRLMLPFINHALSFTTRTRTRNAPASSVVVR